MLLHRLVGLITWCSSLGRMLIIHLFFSVSALTVFHSWLVRDGNVIFFSDITFFKVPKFFLLVLAFVLCLSVWCFRYNDFAFQFGSSVFISQYLSFRFLYSGLVDIIPYLFVGVVLMFQGQQTNLYYHPTLVSKS